jgi:hypothetical protein
LSSNHTISEGDVIVQNNSVLTIPDGVTLDIDLTNYSLTVKFGSGVLIQSGGKIISIAPPDSDEDGIPDSSDNCPSIANANQNDLDLDNTGDACDPSTVITSDTTLTADTILDGDLVVESGFVLTINPGVTLDIDFVNQKVLVKSGGGILVKSGGNIT